MIAIVDYNAGNLTSVQLALESLQAPAEVCRDPERIRAAERVIFPGVGAAGASMENVQAFGLQNVLCEVIERGTPFLGICVGMQILLTHSEEDGGTDCLGMLDGEVRRFPADIDGCKIPQMGWNTVRFRQKHALFDGIDDNSEFYFVHSYYPAPADSGVTMAETEYASVTFASVAGRDNLVATQFHPEKSGRIGLRFLKNFVTWDG